MPNTQVSLTLANLRTAEAALRDEPYERLPVLAGTLAVAAMRFEEMHARTELLEGTVRELLDAMREYELSVDDPPTPEHRDTDANCREILECIVRQCNQADRGEPVVSFEPDWGGNSLTVNLLGLGHSHVGDPDSTFEQLVDSLHSLLCHGSGLSFAPEQESES